MTIISLILRVVSGMVSADLRYSQGGNWLDAWHRWKAMVLKRHGHCGYRYDHPCAGTGIANAAIGAYLGATGQRSQYLP